MNIPPTFVTSANYCQHYQSIQPSFLNIFFFSKQNNRHGLDKNPQIWNVFIGDMSLVGPRPALPSLYEKFGEIAKKRCEVRPGMTGWAQVNGNIYLPWEERLCLDREYVDRMSFMLDLRILVNLKTP